MMCHTNFDSRPPLRRSGPSNFSAGEVLDRVPGARDAIRERLEADPEYKMWLQEFGRDVLRAVD